MSSIGTIIGSLAALFIIFGESPARIAAAQDQPIKRTELHRSDLADIVGKEAVIYIADVMPGAQGGRHTHYGDEYVYVLERHARRNARRPTADHVKEGRCCAYRAERWNPCRQKR